MAIKIRVYNPVMGEPVIHISDADVARFRSRVGPRYALVRK